MRELVPDPLADRTEVATTEPISAATAVAAAPGGAAPIGRRPVGAHRSEPKTSGLGRGFWALLMAFFVANLGSGITSVAFPWLGTEVTRNPLLISGIAVAAELPWLLFSLPAGALIDRSEPRRMISATHLLRAVVVGLLAVAVFYDATSIVLLYAVAFAVGTLTVANENASQTILPRVVATKQLEQANSNLVMADTVAGVFLGPVLGAVLLSVAISLPFFVDAGLYAAAALLMLFVVVAHRQPVEKPRTSLRTEIRAGMRYFWDHRVIRQLGLLLGVLNLASAIAIGTQVLFAQELLGLNVIQYGALFALGAVGAAAGAGFAPWLEERLGARRVLLLSLAGNGAVSLTIGLTSSPILVAGAIAVGAALAVVWNVVTVSYRQRIVPEHLLGRVNSIYRLLAWGPLSVGSLIGGLLVTGGEFVAGREVGLRTPLFVAAAIALVAFGYALLRLREGVWSKNRADHRPPEDGAGATPDDSAPSAGGADGELSDRDPARARAGGPGLPAFGGSGGAHRPVLKVLIFGNVMIAAIWVLLLALDNGLTVDAALFSGTNAVDQWSQLDADAIDNGQVWRLLTSMFVHFGLLHLLSNMLMLGLAGWRLEPLLGSARFLVLYLLCGLGAAVATYLYDDGFKTAGASGANFGVFAALLVVCLRLRIRAFLAIGLVIFGVVTTFAIPGMAVVAHAAGLLFGAVLALGYALPAGDRRSGWQRAVPIATLVVLLALTATGLALR